MPVSISCAWPCPGVLAGFSSPPIGSICRSCRRASRSVRRVPESSLNESSIKERYMLTGIFAIFGSASAVNRARPSIFVRSTSSESRWIRASDIGSASFNRLKNASVPSPRTSESGSCPSGRNKNRMLNSSLKNGSIVSRARFAAVRPALSPSKQTITWVVCRLSRSRCWLVSEVPRVATAKSIPNCERATTSMYPSTTKTRSKDRHTWRASYRP